MSTSDHRLLDRLGGDYVDRETIEGLLFAAPYLIVFVVFLAVPLVYGLYMSFFEWNFLNPDQSEFVGLENYRTIIADGRFHTALLQTFYFVFLTVPAMTVLGVVMALGVNRGIKGTRFLQFAYFVPYVTTVSIVGLLWVQMYGANGVFTQYTAWLFGRVLSDTSLAMPGLALTTVWWQVGFFFAILLAARQSVPEHLYEAAKLDGAGTIRMTWDITIPQMKNSIIFCVIAGTILQFQVFGQPFVMTDGGPAGSTETAVFYLYELGFRTFDLGYGAAVGYVIMVILIAISLVNYYVIEETVN
ncbi:ABC transporter permease [Natronococcus pandeyae]|uniref:ABC transporter permease n=1 Tax=Natronococcus pandeyae TaxID=2055836 RepID=A0A8J8TPU8_9EURY|nr:sugar ABC transporter permease [Natronococcus pandeyae]TYL37808.1 ABC transporter permease [Natronococcus pandeyae]